MCDDKLSGLVKRLQQQQEADAPVEIREVTLALDAITDRPGGDTRPLNPKHVEGLCESIATLGLLEPLVTDSQGRLLAGGHRRCALFLLKDQQPQTFAAKFPDDQIPVRILPFDAEKEPELALQVEITENEVRRDYTPSEVRAVADRLREAGFRDEPGRPKKGEKQLKPALTVIFGKNIATVRRYLNQPDRETRAPTRVSSDLLKRSLKNLQQWQQQQREAPTAAEEALIKMLPKIEKAIARVLEQKDPGQT